MKILLFHQLPECSISATLQTWAKQPRGLIRLQFWNFWPNRRSALLFDVTTFYKKNPWMYTQDLLVLNDHLAAGQLNPVLDATFPLEEGKHALEYLRDGKAKGKMVLLTEAYKS